MKTFKQTPKLFNPNLSSNQLYILYSILPKQYQLFQKIPQIKNKHFYHPDECIWNNPHRTSKKLYKYYHQGCHQYTKFKEPEIRMQEQQDLNEQETNRILRLASKRQEMRSKFYSKKLQRLNLQLKAGLKRDSQKQLNEASKSLNKTFLQQVQLKQPNKSKRTENSQQKVEIENAKQKLQNTSKLVNQVNSTRSKSLGSCFSTKSFKKNYAENHLKTKLNQKSFTEKKYLESIQNFDKKQFERYQIFKQSERQIQNKIRQNFKQQVQNNFKKSSQIITNKLAKSSKSTLKVHFFIDSKRKQSQNFTSVRF